MAEEMQPELEERLRRTEQRIQSLQEEDLRLFDQFDRLSREFLAERTARLHESVTVSGHLEGMHTSADHRHQLLSGQITNVSTQVSEIRVEVENVTTTQLGSNSLQREAIERMARLEDQIGTLEGRLEDRMRTLEEGQQTIIALLQQRSGGTSEEQPP